MGDFRQDGAKAHKADYRKKQQETVKANGAEFRDINSTYDEKNVWVVTTGEHVAYLEINGVNNHFSAKHLIFSGENDEVKLQKRSNGNAVTYLTGKAKSRLGKRNLVSEPDESQAKAKWGTTERADYENGIRRRNKYGNVATPTACMLNMKSYAGMPHLLKEAAADRIAAAFRASGGKANGVAEVEVDFGCNCVITAYKAGYVKFGSKMLITGSFGKDYSAAKGGAIKLFHAVTTGLDQGDSPL